MSAEHGHDLAYPESYGPPLKLEVLASVAGAPAPPPGFQAMTAYITLPPGSPGSPPHRHSGPVFAYMVKGEILFELEGHAPRVIKAGEAFWEPGGDVIHYQNGNNLADEESAFVAMMLGAPGQPMLIPVSAEEL